DLEIVDASIETPQPVVDKAVIIRLRLRNNGPENVSNSRLFVELQVFNNAVLKFDKRVGRVSSGEILDWKTVAMLGGSIPSTEGNFVLKWLGSDANITDPVPENNSYLLHVSMIPRMADLLPQQVKLDKQGNLVFYILNKGNAPSDASVAALFVN